MAAKKYVKMYRYMFIYRFIIHLMLIHATTGLVDGDKLNFDQSFLQFTVKKKMYMRRVNVK